MPRFEYSLHLLSGVSTHARTALSRAGVTSVHQIAMMQPEDLMQFKGIKTTAYRIHTQACAYVANCPIWTGQLPARSMGKAWFFDIETNPESGIVWSIGWCNYAGDHAIVVVAPNTHIRSMELVENETLYFAQDADDAWRIFARATGTDDEPILHWTGFDAGVMARTAPQSVIDALSPRLMDLHRVFKSVLQIPARGTSLKVVAPYFGFEWRQYADWEQAWLDYNDWLISGNYDVLYDAVAYQKDDVEAMRVVLAWLIENRPASG